MTLTLRVETEQESARRWIADIIDLPGVMAYGPTEAQAVEAAQALALEVLADRIKHGEDLRTGRRSLVKKQRRPVLESLKFAV